jgi:hypothetical protein
LIALFIATSICWQFDTAHLKVENQPQRFQKADDGVYFRAAFKFNCPFYDLQRIDNTAAWKINN